MARRQKDGIYLTEETRYVRKMKVKKGEEQGSLRS